MLRSVFYVGWDSPLPKIEHTLPVRIHPSEAEQVARTTLATIVLGDRGLGALQPMSLLSALGRATRRCILVPSADLEGLAEWIEAGFSQVSSRAGLEARLGDAVVPIAEVSDVIRELGRTGASGDGGLALASLIRSRAPTVDAWAEALGCSRRTLHRTCVREFGQPPTRVRLAYVRAVVTAARRAGYSMSQVASELGYSDNSSLRRAIRLPALERDTEKDQGPI